MLKYAATIFVSAFLLFQVQPMLGRYILPWFGGSAGVWSVVLLFFQAFLLAGYGYAHLSVTRFKPKLQLAVHLGLLAACVFLLPIIPSEAFRPTDNSYPTIKILLLLTVTVGLPYFLLASTGPLLQAWFAKSEPGKSPYSLYALSNVGSLLALVSYPFVIETLIGRQMQAMSWSYGFGTFALLAGGISVSTYRSRSLATIDAIQPSNSFRPREFRHSKLFWVLLPAAGTALLMSVTNQLCLDVAPMPFLWVLPLSLYLLSFIFAFAGERWYPRRHLVPLLPMIVLGTTYALLDASTTAIWLNVAMFSCALFLFCMVCHGEVFRLRPASRNLTGFYLMVSLGGVLGGAAVALLAPLVFVMFLEFHVAMLTVFGLVMAVLYLDPESRMHRGKLRPVWGAIAFFFMGTITIQGYDVYQNLENNVYVTRSFYGVMYVNETQEFDGKTIREIRSGTTLHGVQRVDDDGRSEPVAYFTRTTGMGFAIRTVQNRGAANIGVVGLGAGTIAAFTREGDSLTFYEINSDVRSIAEEYFTYLSDSAVEPEIVLGDARLMMERETPREFDILIVDAFSSDAIPIHLLTQEAFHEYRRHIKKGRYFVCAYHESPSESLACREVWRGIHRRCSARIRNAEKTKGAAEWLGMGGCDLSKVHPC